MSNFLKTILEVATPNGGGNSWLPSHTLSKDYADHPGEFVRALLNMGIVLVVVISVGVLIYAGFKYVTSQGDSSKTQEAAKTIMYAIIGIIVALAAGVIVNLVWTKLTGGQKLPDIDINGTATP